MHQVIIITPTTMKRLLNYQRVVENEAKTADKTQWMKMTPENMRRSEAGRQKAERIDAIVAYAGMLFRIQNKMMPFRSLHGDDLLHNMLVELMHELRIPVEWGAVDCATEDDWSPEPGSGKTLRLIQDQTP